MYRVELSIWIRVCISCVRGSAEIIFLCTCKHIIYRTIRIGLRDGRMTSSDGAGEPTWTTRNRIRKLSWGCRWPRSGHMFFQPSFVRGRLVTCLFATSTFTALSNSFFSKTFLTKYMIQSVTWKIITGKQKQIVWQIMWQIVWQIMWQIVWQIVRQSWCDKLCDKAMVWSLLIGLTPKIKN